MKKIIIVFTLVLCLLLPACFMNTAPVDNLPDNDPDVTEDIVEAEKSTQAESDDAFGNPKQADISNVSNVSYLPLDYSGHDFPDEDQCNNTVLADPSKLIDGEKIIVEREEILDWDSIREGHRGLEVKDKIWGYDVQYSDLSDEDLSTIEDFNDLSFNTRTIWPNPDKLPKGFEPAKILEFNKNPGLGIRALHEQGITGVGVGVAMIDQPLLVDHEQYADNLMYYEKIHAYDGVTMHGPAMTSIMVGKDIGVAPESKLYYISSEFGHVIKTTYFFDASIIADCILRILEINSYIPEDEKIRVIAICKDYYGNDKGFQELTDAIKKADDENIFVVTASPNTYYNFRLNGMGRGYLDNPDDFNSYYPSWLWSEIMADFYSNPEKYTDSDRLLVPTDSRTFAGASGATDYGSSPNGGLSIAVSWLAGFYALCCQVKPDITPQEFIDISFSTSKTTKITLKGESYPFGKIINPSAVIAELQK